MEKVKKRITGEANDVNKQTLYSAKISKWIIGALHPGAHTEQKTVQEIVQLHNATQ